MTTEASPLSTAHLCCQS